MKLSRLSILILVTLFPATVWPAHPLVTDDAGTQGKGRYQLEVNGQYDRDRQIVEGASTKTSSWQAGVFLSYGLLAEADLIVGIPYERFRVRQDGQTVFNEEGLSDATMELKWRFFQEEAFSLALKPGLRLPTGDEQRGLGAGRVGCQLYFIGSWEKAPWALHLNGGYERNENRLGEEKDLWHASLAATRDLGRGVTIVANVGAQRNPDRTSGQDPAFVLGGLIYNVTESLSVDAGIKFGLNDAETDRSLLAGLSLRF